MATHWFSRGKLGNGEHLSLEAYKYKENNIYVLIIMQHKENVKFYPETHINITSVDRKLCPIHELTSQGENI